MAVAPPGRDLRTMKNTTLYLVLYTWLFSRWFYFREFLESDLANFVSQGSRKFPLQYMSIYSNENIRKLQNLSPHKFPLSPKPRKYWRIQYIIISRYKTQEYKELVPAESPCYKRVLSYGSTVQPIADSQEAICAKSVLPYFDKRKQLTVYHLNLSYWCLHNKCALLPGQILCINTHPAKRGVR